MSTVNEKKPELMMVNVVGRVEAMRRYEGLTYTRIICPAADAYSRPDIVQIRSKGRIGQAGEEVGPLKCKLSGYKKKPFRFTDKATGEQIEMIPVDHNLDLVE